MDMDKYTRKSLEVIEKANITATGNNLVVDMKLK